MEHLFDFAFCHTIAKDGLVKTNMEKLTFYALSSPEKLDRIGEYLAQRVARDLNRHRIGYVEIAMQAMDNLLQACHAQSLNLFVESFLKIVQQLLENSEFKMQLLATSSFVKFANIEEDTPSYHRRYDFFVSKFSSLCHSADKQPDTRCKLRIAGLCGIRGVIRKTVSDDLQVNIWDEHHMDKIVPSFLFNLADTEVYDIALTNDELLKSVKKLKSKKTNEPFRKQPQSKNLNVEIVQSSFGVSLDEESGVQSNAIQQPRAVAEECLRELMGRANYGNIRSVIKPVLKHLDHHKLWNEDNEFAINVFKIIMYSIQSQHSYAVIQLLMAHLDEKTRHQRMKAGEPADRLHEPIADDEVTTKVRTGIVLVLSSIVAIAAAESVGPSVLEIINSLLSYLRNSIGNYHVLKQRQNVSVAVPTSNVGTAEENLQDEQLEDEKIFQNTVINTLGEFANNLPDFQKIEIMVFILNKVSQTDLYLQDILLKSLLKVSTKHKTLNMAQAFPSNFLNPLLTMSLAKDHQVRLTVQLILHQLLDRHDNLRKLRNATLSSLPGIVIGKASRQDLMFMKKHGNEILLHLYENFKFANNRKENYNALYVTLALLCVEMSTEDTLAELLRFIFAIQDFALNYFGSTQNGPVGDTKETQRSSTLGTTTITNGIDKDGARKLNSLHVSVLHCIVASFLHFTSQLTVIPAFCAHTEQVVKQRNSTSKHLLPEFNPLLNHQTPAQQTVEPIDRIELKRAEKFAFKDASFEVPETEINLDLSSLNEDCLFSKQAIVEALRSSGHDTALLLTPFTPSNVGKFCGHFRLNESVVMFVFFLFFKLVTDSKMSRSTSDLNSINVEVESVNSSPGLPRVSVIWLYWLIDFFAFINRLFCSQKHPGEEITFESLKKAFTEEIDQSIKTEKRIQLVEQYKSLPFEDLINRHDRKSSDLQHRLNEIFSKLVAVKDVAFDSKLNYKVQELQLSNWSDIIINNII